MSMDTTPRIAAHRIVLAPNNEQQNLMSRHCGASRWAYNYALEKKLEAHQKFSEARDELMKTIDKEDEKERRKEANKMMRGNKEYSVPNYMAISNLWTVERGDQTQGIDGVSPWWKYGEKRNQCLARQAFINGFQNADSAWKNWLDSYSGKRKGKRVGYPRFKSKRTSRDSYTLYHDKNKPSIRPVDNRHIRIPSIGVVRTESPIRGMKKRFDQDQLTVCNMTISRRGDRWVASVVVEEHTSPQKPPKSREENIGVDLGVKESAALSNGDLVPNPRHLKESEKRLKTLQRQFSRTQKGSNRRKRVVQKISVQHARVAERRKAYLDKLTKHLAMNYQNVCIEDLNVSGMTSSAKGTVENPGTNVKAKSGLNRAVLDVGFHEFRRQVSYKSDWYDSALQVAPRFAPTSKRCAECGEVKETLKLSERTFYCESCENTEDRDVNAAKNIVFYAHHPEAVKQ